MNLGKRPSQSGTPSGEAKKQKRGNTEPRESGEKHRSSHQEKRAKKKKDEEQRAKKGKDKEDLENKETESGHNDVVVADVPPLSSMDAEGKELVVLDPIPQGDEPFSTPADTDKFLKELDDYIEKNIPESVKQRARTSSGKFYSNRVLTISSGSSISSPRDPKATVFPIPIPASDESVLGYLDDEGDSTLPQSKKFDAPAKKKMVGEMLKCAPEGYTNTLRGYNEAHVGPIMTDLANVSICVCLS